MTSSAIMRHLTHLGGVRFNVAFPLGLMAFGGPARALGLQMLLAIAGSHVAVQILKRMVARPRPCDASGRVLALVDLPDPFSFPSGHAAAAAALGGVALLSYPVLAPLAVAFAGAVSASRVALRVHHVGDVLAGVTLGFAGALAATYLM